MGWNPQSQTSIPLLSFPLFLFGVNIVPKMKKFTVRWLEEREIVVEAKNSEEALEKARDNLSKGEMLEAFDFRVYEEP